MNSEPLNLLIQELDVMDPQFSRRMNREGTLLSQRFWEGLRPLEAPLCVLCEFANLHNSLGEVECVSCPADGNNMGFQVMLKGMNHG